MNIYKEILLILQQLQILDIVVILADRPSATVKQQDVTGDVIVIDNDISATVKKTTDGRFLKDYKINISFLSNDEFDNFDVLEDANNATFDVIERMRSLANKVIYLLTNDFKTGILMLSKGFVYQETNVVREGVHTQSGVKITISLPIVEIPICEEN